jgi:hypothetical protein
MFPLSKQYMTHPATEWYEAIVQRNELKKKTDPEYRIPEIYECPDRNVVWTQPHNAVKGCYAELEGIHLSDPDRLEPIPLDINPVEPRKYRVREGAGKRRGGARR